MQELLKIHFPDLVKHHALRDALLKKAFLKDFLKGEVLLREGAYVKLIPLLVSGLVKVYKEDELGNEVLLYYIKAGESCIMSLTHCLNNEMSSVKAIVEEDAQIMLLPADHALKLFNDYRIWNEFLFRLFNAKYEELLHIISLLTFSNKDSRLMDYLNKEALLKESHFIKTTHQKIADDLGSSREVISRLLKKLEKEGKLRLHHGEIELVR